MDRNDTVSQVDFPYLPLLIKVLTKCAPIVVVYIRFIVSFVFGNTSRQISFTLANVCCVTVAVKLTNVMAGFFEISLGFSFFNEIY